MPGKLVAVETAQMVCDKGSAPAALLATCRTAKFGGQWAANIYDFVPGKNIPPFGRCGALNTSCSPDTCSPWVPVLQTVNLWQPVPLLSEAAMLSCKNGGIITIVYGGQSAISLANPKVPGGMCLPLPPGAAGGSGSSACGADASAGTACGAEAGACGAAASAGSACGAAASACGAQVSAGTACGAEASACGAAASGATACGAAASACGAAASGATACGAAASACGAAASGATACGAQLGVCGADAAGAEACAAQGPCAADACGADACALDLTPADACAADACAIDVIPIIPLI